MLHLSLEEFGLVLVSGNIETGGAKQIEEAGAKGVERGAAAGVRKVKARGSCGGRGSRKARGSRGAWKPFDGLAPVATK
jgi:hypothetical protein